MTELPATSQGNWQSTNKTVKTVKHHTSETAPTPTPTPTQVTPEPATRRNRYAALDFEFEDLSGNLVVQRIISSSLRRQNIDNNDGSNSIVIDSDDDVAPHNIVNDIDDDFNDIETVIEIVDLPQGIGLTAGTSSSSSSS